MRQEIETRISDLRRARGAAVLDKAKHSELDAEIEAAEGDLAAIDDAEGERARRDREAAAQELGQIRRRKLEHLVGSHGRRLAAYQDANIACRTLMDALKVIRQESTVERILWAELAPGTVPNGLMWAISEVLTSNLVCEMK